MSVVRNHGLPALDTPCSRSTDPLCQGVGQLASVGRDLLSVGENFGRAPSDQRTAANSKPIPFRLINIACGARDCSVFAFGEIKASRSVSTALICSSSSSSRSSFPRG